MEVLILETSGYNRDMIIPHELDIYNTNGVVGHCIWDRGMRYKISENTPPPPRRPNSIQWESSHNHSSWSGVILNLEITYMQDSFIDIPLQFEFEIRGGRILGLQLVNVPVDVAVPRSYYLITGLI